MDIFDAGRILKQRQDEGKANLIKKPNVIPVTLKRLTSKNGVVSLDPKKHFVGQEWWLRLDTLGNWQVSGPRGDVYDMPVISAVDSNGGDLGRVCVEFFFL